LPNIAPKTALGLKRLFWLAKFTLNKVSILPQPHRVGSGRAGFLAIPSAPSRLRDLNAVVSEKAKTIPAMTEAVAKRENVSVTRCLAFDFWTKK
jgi:hypothetical protein